MQPVKSSLQILRNHTAEKLRGQTTVFLTLSSGVSWNFFRGEGVQQIQLRREDRVNGDLGAVAP
jgi:hypothetical protein